MVAVGSTAGQHEEVEEVVVAVKIRHFFDASRRYFSIDSLTNTVLTVNGMPFLSTLVLSRPSSMP